MFNETSIARAAALLQAYGATHFMLMPDGKLLVVSGVHNLEVEDAPDVQLGPTPTELAKIDADLAIKLADASSKGEAAPEPLTFKQKALALIGL